MENKEIIFEAKSLVKNFSDNGRQNRKDVLTAVDHVSFHLTEGEILGLLGESGSGKTTLARLIMLLLRPDSGTILYKGTEIQNLKKKELRNFRKKIQMVFQNPFDSLNPQIKVGKLLEEPLKIWFPQMNKTDRNNRIAEICRECGLPADFPDKYPSEFSGGQLQRLSIARALLVEPEILVADEVISALDVSRQSQILDLLLEMKEKFGLTILFITHDLMVARNFCDRVMVMKNGKLCGTGSPEEILNNSDNTYIRELSSAVFRFYV